MEKLREWVAERRGRAADLAAALGVPASFVTKMAGGERPVPIAHMAKIEEITQGAVTRRDLRPDDWQDIWPELADHQPHATKAEAQEVSHA